MISNLKTHRDGSTSKGRSALGCPGRRKAIETGLSVPPSVSESLSSKSTPIGNHLSLFSKRQQPKFDNLTFNQIMMIWIVQSSLPWSRIEDQWLRAGIQYLRPDTKVYGRKWIFKEAARLNASMKDVVFKELQVNTTST